jgi:hypothetical protein
MIVSEQKLQLIISYYYYIATQESKYHVPTLIWFNFLLLLVGFPLTIYITIKSELSIQLIIMNPLLIHT